MVEHPELLDGEQIRPGDARRWILITREKGTAPSSGETNRPSGGSSRSRYREDDSRTFPGCWSPFRQGCQGHGCGVIV